MFSKLPILLELAMLRPVGGGFKFGYNRGILWLLISHRGLHVWFGTWLIHTYEATMVKMLHMQAAKIISCHALPGCDDCVGMVTVVETQWFADVPTYDMVQCRLRGV